MKDIRSIFATFLVFVLPSYAASSAPRYAELVKEKVRALQSLVGNWNYYAKYSQGPRKGEDAYAGSAQIRFDQENYYVRMEHNFKQNGEAHTALVMITFDPLKSKYVMYSFRSGPGPFVYEGELINKTIEWTCMSPAKPGTLMGITELSYTERKRTWTFHNPDGSVKSQIIEEYTRNEERDP